MGERRQPARFALEAHQRIGMRGQLRSEDLQGDVTAETAIVGTPHHTHAARAELLDELVNAQARSRLHGGEW